MNYYCSVCRLDFESEEPDVLTFSTHGGCKHICPSCKELYETATLSRDPDAAEAAIAELKKITADSRDMTILRLLSDVIPEAESRARQIREGTYDFSADETAEEPIEIPEELRITEEDLAEIQEEAEPTASATLFDKILNCAWIGIGALAVAAILFFIIRAIL